jgi:hypothetical protein
MPSMKRALEPLIPLEQFKKLVEKIAHVPRSVIERDSSKTKPERKSGRKKRDSS